MRLLRQLSNSMRPDVAIGFMHSAYIPLSLAVAGLRLPVVGSEHIVFDHYKARPKEAFLLRATHRLLSALTVTSEPVRSSFPAAVRKQMTVIRNPVVIPDQAGADVIGRPDRRKRLLSVGRLDQQKDFATLIEAFARIAPAVHDWDLRIIGEGALRPSLERQIKEAGLGGRISLPGATADIAREYASAQLFVLPSRYESFGLVTAEALACGLPAIGFRDCPGTNEMILHGRNGLLVAGEDRAAALADGLHELMMSPDMRQQLGAEGPASVAQFSPDVAIAKWEQFLTRVKSRENLG
jgi:glycosyltransferase involved in cell wall biosynthesis